jgi:hypothetical protein
VVIQNALVNRAILHDQLNHVISENMSFFQCVKLLNELN